MKTLLAVTSLLTFSAGAWAASPASFARGPKNLMSPTYHGTVTAAPHKLTRKDVKRLEAAAETRADHQKIAGFYQNQAANLEAQAAAYENAAATLRKRPEPKNFAAPGTAERWEFLATGFRKEANSNRAAAAAHERMADASASF